MFGRAGAVRENDRLIIGMKKYFARIGKSVRRNAQQ
jgi:hypothetical protein